MIYDAPGKVHSVRINSIPEICGRLERVKRKLKKNDEVTGEVRLGGGLGRKIKATDKVTFKIWHDKSQEIF